MFDVQVEQHYIYIYVKALETSTNSITKNVSELHLRKPFLLGYNHQFLPWIMNGSYEQHVAVWPVRQGLTLIHSLLFPIRVTIIAAYIL